MIADSAEPQAANTSQLDRKLEAARRELLETSTRSRLLHTPLGSPRTKTIEIQDELAEEVYRILVREGKAMSFLAAQDDAPADAEQLALAQPEEETDEAGGLAARYVDSKLQTGLSPEMLQTRLRSLAYDAQTFENEQGVNILYLAIGFLKWLEPHNRQAPRFAPLVLVPVTLTRTSAQERFKIAYSGEEIGTNLSLQQRLKEEDVELPDLPDDFEDLSPTTYAEAVTSAVQGALGWAVQPNSMVLGFFSFAKLMMYRDLKPQPALSNHPIINGLLGDGFPDLSDSLLPDDDATPVDPLIDIAAAGHVVDADSSQMLAIEEVKRGRHLVIQGPPGTGKSQTITNLIAAAVRDGKRVLFVAEKMAALNVVRSNLDRADLGSICLELHSHKAKKKAVLEDLKNTYELAARSPLATGEVDQKLRARRDALNEHARRVHTPMQPSGYTPFQAFGTLAKLAGLGHPTPDAQLPKAREWTRPEVEDRIGRLGRLAELVSKIGAPTSHPWRGAATKEALLPGDASRLGARADEISRRLAKLIDGARRVGTATGMPCKSFSEAESVIGLVTLMGKAPRMDATAMESPEWTERRSGIEKLLEMGGVSAGARRSLGSRVPPQAWDADIQGIAIIIREHGKSLFRWLRRDYREAVRRFRGVCLAPIPSNSTERLRVLDTLASGQRARQFVHGGDAVGRSAFGSEWNGEDSDWPLLTAIEAWERAVTAASPAVGWRAVLPRLRANAAISAEVSEFADELQAVAGDLQSLLTDLVFNTQAGFNRGDLGRVPLEALRDRLAAWAGSAERLQEWWTWRNWSDQLRALGVGALVDRLADGRLPPDSAIETLSYAHAEALVRQALSDQPDLAAFDGRTHEQVQEEFKRLDMERLHLARLEVSAKHLAGIPRGGRDVGELGTLAHEWHKQRRHLPLRQLVKVAGRAMQRIKPVWMMSPMSLAQFVEPGALEFDLVVMDEASQVRPVDALGAVSRGNQLVVVGDDQQLPPTSFFDRVALEEEEATEEDTFQVADVESILDLCTAQRMPARMLRWHYRSQHESLIAVSNLEFYKRLFIVPSASSDNLGLRLSKVAGIYDRGRSATNKIEAQAVARSVIDHAQRHALSSRFPQGMSLGVGTFSVAQRDAVLDELEVLLRQHPEVAGFFDPNAPEPFFVKNLESIQGDERDVIFISVGYGPDVDGYMAMTFGPISQQGGERRLNVLISRARRRCEVFSSVTAGDIDLARGQSVGVRVLKTFLNYAETGQLERSEVGHRDIDSDFEADVGQALQALGYPIEHQIGVAGFFIDMAVKDQDHPGRYVIGIECDGAAYHSSRSARDRDRLREQVLRDRGWAIHRIWSVDWFRRRHQEIQRAVAAITAAQAAPPSVQVPTRSAPPAPTHAPEPTRNGEQSPNPSPAYVEASFSVPINVEPHQLGLGQHVEILVRIAAVEGPIHEDELGRRFATVVGKDRAGSRIQAATKQALNYAVRGGKLHADGAFYAVEAITECVPRDRSSVRSTTLRKPEMLPPLEIQTGLRRVVVEQIGVEPQGAVVELSRMFGFQRTGADFQEVVQAQLRTLLGNGVLVLKNGNRLYAK